MQITIFHTSSRCLKIRENVSFNMASKASYVYEWSIIGQKLVENAKLENSNATLWVIFKHCAHNSHYSMENHRDNPRNP